MFCDIDEQVDFDSCYGKLCEGLTNNFVVEFGAGAARCVSNLDLVGFATLLEQPRPASFPTRWINFWGGEGQRDTIKKIASCYKLSPRLINLLCPGQSSTNHDVNTAPALKLQDGSDSSLSSSARLGTGTENVHIAQSTDLQATANSGTPLTALKKQATGFEHVVEELWHFCSIDWGEGYVHIGLNRLFPLPASDTNSRLDKPEGLRLWNSLVLCKDGTVISVYQTPQGPSGRHPDVLKVIRRNVLNIFRQLSALHKGKEDSLNTVTIRNYDMDFEKDPNHRSESANLLLYYLLDDWTTSYGLVTQKDLLYRTQLDEIRKRMFQTPDILVIEKLHSIGRELHVLKLMYQSYELIVDRILRRQQTMKSETRWQIQNHRHYYPEGVHHNSHIHGEDPLPALRETPENMDSSLIGVRLSMSAIVRLERLLDRIRLLALTEIEDCLAEKESLAVMSFNLITLKESQAIEKLTRITILLAKATLLFLPVSLMTGYFSVQIADLQGVYSARTYWLCFMIISLLSIAGLFVFGVASDRLEGRLVYKSLTRAFLEGGQRKKKVS